MRRTNTEFNGKVQERIETAAWLPDDLKIAAVSSGKVREWVTKSINDFYTN